MRIRRCCWTEALRQRHVEELLLNQISVIRPHADPRQFITTNTMGWFDGFDEYTVHSVLDIAAWDDYITGDYDYVANGAITT